jgi:hypothetical protein
MIIMITVTTRQAVAGGRWLRGTWSSSSFPEGGAADFWPQCAVALTGHGEGIDGESWWMCASRPPLGCRPRVVTSTTGGTMLRLPDASAPCNCIGILSATNHSPAAIPAPWKGDDGRPAESDRLTPQAWC